jgi:hypothetical protein
MNAAPQAAPNTVLNATALVTALPASLTNALPRSCWAVLLRLALLTLLALSSARVSLHAQAIPIDSANQPPRNWLIVEVLEKGTPGSSTGSQNGKSASDREIKFSDFLPVIIVDSLTQGVIYARSGEVVQIGNNRTYFVSVASGRDAPLNIQGEAVQRVRTGTPTDDDVIFQKEFIVLNASALPTVPATTNTAPSSSLPPKSANPAPRTSTDIEELKQQLAQMRRELDRLRVMPEQPKRTADELRGAGVRNAPPPRTAANTNVTPADVERAERAERAERPRTTPAMPAPPARRGSAEGVEAETSLAEQPSGTVLEPYRSSCVFGIQFCAVPVQREAERIRNLLMQEIEDARVEVFDDGRRNITFYRVRGGCFMSYSQARVALRQYVRTSERLRIGVQPFVVRNP